MYHQIFSVLFRPIWLFLVNDIEAGFSKKKKKKLFSVCDVVARCLFFRLRDNQIPCIYNLQLPIKVGLTWETYFSINQCFKDM